MVLQCINKVLGDIAEAENQLSQIKSEERKLEYILSQTKGSLQYMIKPTYRIRLNALIVRKVNARIAQTGEREESIREIAEEFGVSCETVRWIYADANKSKKALYRYALHFTAIKMRNAGFSTKEIAKTLGITQKYVYVLLKSKIPLEV